MLGCPQPISAEMMLMAAREAGAPCHQGHKNPGSPCFGKRWANDALKRHAARGTQSPAPLPMRRKAEEDDAHDARVAPDARAPARGKSASLPALDHSL